MSERIYYVICADGCKFESMTKEQILTAIEQAVSTGKIMNVDTGFVTKIKETNKNAALSFWIGTQAEYNALTEKAQNCFYIISDDTSGEELERLLSELMAKTNETQEKMSVVESAEALNEQRITALEANAGKKFYSDSTGVAYDGKISISEDIANYSLLGIMISDKGTQQSNGSMSYRPCGSGMLHKTSESAAFITFEGALMGKEHIGARDQYMGSCSLSYNKSKKEMTFSYSMGKCGDANNYTVFRLLGIYGIC